MFVTGRRQICPKLMSKQVDGAAIGPRNGSCGTAMYTRRPVVVTDVLTDPLWADYRGLARDLRTVRLLVNAHSVAQR